MTDAIRDENHVPSLLGLSYVDGVTVVPIKVNSANGGIEFDETNTVSTQAQQAARDNNHVKTLMAVDSVSGEAIPVFVNPSTGGILVDMT